MKRHEWQLLAAQCQQASQETHGNGGVLSRVFDTAREAALQMANQDAGPLGDGRCVLRVPAHPIRCRLSHGHGGACQP